MEHRAIWWDEKCRWPETRITFDLLTDSVADILALHDEKIRWLYENIDNCENHCRWRISDVDGELFRFRHERDQLMFILRWA